HADRKAAHLRARPRHGVVRHAHGAGDYPEHGSGRQQLVGAHPERYQEPAVPDAEDRIVIITRKHIPRRTILRGIGASLALPLLDSMVPALTLTRLSAAAPIRRFGAIYVGMGVNMPMWTQPAAGTLEINPILEPM